MAGRKLLTRYNWKARQQTKQQASDTNKLIMPCKRKEGRGDVEEQSKSKKRKFNDRERKKLRKVSEAKARKAKVCVVVWVILLFTIAIFQRAAVMESLQSHSLTAPQVSCLVSSCSLGNRRLTGRLAVTGRRDNYLAIDRWSRELDLGMWPQLHRGKRREEEEDCC